MKATNQSRLITGQMLRMNGFHTSVHLLFGNLMERKFHQEGHFETQPNRSVPLFFNTTDASDVSVFNKFVNIDSIDKLRKQKGWAIISTHLGKGFYRGNRLDPEFKRSMEYLASLPGWFVPVSQLLDFISVEVGSQEISTIERMKIETSHIIDKINGKIFDPALY